MFAVGFMSLLYALLSRLIISFPSWEGALISTPRITSICEPGTYHQNQTTSAYCQDTEGRTQRSIQCIKCPENTFSSQANQAYCEACEYGTYSLAGSSECTSCYSTPKIVNNMICERYFSEEQTADRYLMMAIFIPIGIVLFALFVGIIVWYFKKRFSKQRAIGSDENWLLSFDDLIKSEESPSDDALMKETQRDIIRGANGRLLLATGSSNNPTSFNFVQRAITPVIGQQDETIATADDANQSSNAGMSLTPSIPDAALIDTLETEGEIPRKRGESKLEGIKFRPENTQLIHVLGF